MTSLRQISEQIIRILSGGDRNLDDSKWDIREIELFVTQAINYFIKQNLFQNISQGQNGIDGQYVITFKNIDVLYDEDLALAYAVLPATYISLPYDRGIVQVSLMKDQFNVFIPIRNGAVAVFKNSPAGRLESRIGFYPEQQNIYFTKDISKDTDKILVKLIIADAQAVNNNQLFIPPDIELPIIEKVLQLLSNQYPQDKLNNNASVS